MFTALQGNVICSTRTFQTSVEGAVRQINHGNIFIIAEVKFSDMHEDVYVSLIEVGPSMNPIRQSMDHFLLHKAWGLFEDYYHMNEADVLKWIRFDGGIDGGRGGIVLA